MVITTGMTSPVCCCVRALNCLQNSMMLMPCWPSAGPTGGAGVALPALHCSFTTACMGFAILLLLASSRRVARRTARSRVGSHRLHLQEVQLHGRGAPEDADHHLDLAPLVVD